jgi:hypothetical protein
MSRRRWSWLRGFFAATFAMSATAVAGQQPPQPQDFAYGMEVRATQQAAAYRLAVPLQVYLGCLRADLGDLRVFNARGEPVPHALQRPRTAAAPGQAPRPMPIFALRGDPQAALDAVRVTIESGRRAVDIRAREAGGRPAGAGIEAYIVDGRTFGEPVSGLQLQWPQDAPEFAGQLRIEAGDRLDSWRAIGAGTVANLRAGDSSLIERSIEFPATRARFWRLSWTGKPAPFELTAVLLQPAGALAEAQRATLTVTGRPAPGGPGAFIFDLGAQPPVDRLDVELPEPNSIARIALSSRADAQAQWQPAGTHGFYRLYRSRDDAGGELRNKAVSIGTRPHRHWRARMAGDAGGMGSGALRLSVEWIAHELVFVARGAGPFTVAYGSSTVASAPASLDAIPKEIDIAAANLAPRHELGGPARLEQPRKPFPWKATLLWAALAIGVALLAWMALRLSKELARNDSA